MAQATVIWWRSSHCVSQSVWNLDFFKGCENGIWLEQFVPSINDMLFPWKCFDTKNCWHLACIRTYFKENLNAYSSIVVYSRNEKWDWHSSARKQLHTSNFPIYVNVISLHILISGYQHIIHLVCVCVIKVDLAIEAVSIKHFEHLKTLLLVKAYIKCIGWSSKDKQENST